MEVELPSPPSFSCASREAGDAELRAGRMRVRVSSRYGTGKPSNYVCLRRHACGACGDALARVRQVAFYALALPLGIGLAFHGDMGLPGLWCVPPPCTPRPHTQAPPDCNTTLTIMGSGLNGSVTG
jgi:hypothetical protein